jgi:hypothetical protein
MNQIDISKYLLQEYKLYINEKQYYEIYIDIGLVTINDKTYSISLQDLYISLYNDQSKEMIYYFTDYPFQIYNNLVKIRGQIVHLDKFNLIVHLGRIKINNTIHTFTLSNNNIIISKTMLFENIIIKELNNEIINNHYTYKTDKKINDNQNKLIIDQIYNKNRIQYLIKQYNHIKNPNNINDSYIMPKLYNLLINLKEPLIIKSQDKVYNEIRNYFTRNDNIFIYIKNLFKSSKEINILDNIYKFNEYVLYYKMKEVQILQLIWSAINDDDEDTKKKFLSNFLNIEKRKEIIFYNNNNCNCNYYRI